MPQLLTGPGAEFVKKYKEKFGKDPEAYAVYGYEAAKVVLEAIKKVGKKDREAILQGRRSATKDFDKGALGKWSFDDERRHHHPEHDHQQGRGREVHAGQDRQSNVTVGRVRTSQPPRMPVGSVR